MKTKKSKIKNKNGVAIFYKSKGSFIGPYKRVFLQKEIEGFFRSGYLTKLRNTVLKSKLELRPTSAST